MTPDAWFAALLGDSYGRVDDDVVYAPTRPEERERYEAACVATGERESVSTAVGKLGRHELVMSVVSFAFLGGSLSLASGERLARAFERATTKAGLLVVCQSGGVRVQEGVLALLQMTRVVAAREALAQAARPLIAWVVDPTFGGVAVSVVGTADVVFAEPGARLGFAGPRAALALGGVARVDTAEEMLAGGFVDAVLPREQARPSVQSLLDALM